MLPLGPDLGLKQLQLAGHGPLNCIRHALGGFVAEHMRRQPLLLGN